MTQQHSLTVPSGSVISQSVAAGTPLLPGTTVDLVVSKGGIATPDVVGKTQDAANATISSAGLVPGTVTRQYNATVPANTVISQTPAAGTPVLPTAAVSLVVSRGVQPAVMPDITGRSQVQAESAIANAGLTLGTVTQEYSGTVAAGSVTAQSPAPGTEVPPGTVVSMVVSLGPTPLPEGEGEPMTTDTARQQLATAYERADSNGDGTLSFDEAAAAVPGLSQAVFNELDTDGNGQLSAGELGLDVGSGCGGCQGGKGTFSPFGWDKGLDSLF